MDTSDNSPHSLLPYYILVSHSPLSDTVPDAPSTNFSQPIIQYHYQDDSALHLLPQHPNEHVLVIDYDPTAPGPPAVKSLSESLVVTGLRIDQSQQSADGKNNDMFVIETTNDNQVESSGTMEQASPQALLAQFKHRNALLRRTVQFPDSRLTQESLETQDTYNPNLLATPKA